MKLISAELSRPLPTIPPCSIGEQWVLVRHHGEPLGFVTPPAAGAHSNDRFHALFVHFITQVAEFYRDKRVSEVIRPRANDPVA